MSIENPVSWSSPARRERWSSRRDTADLDTLPTPSERPSWPSWAAREIETSPWPRCVSLCLSGRRRCHSPTHLVWPRRVPTRLWGRRLCGVGGQRGGTRNVVGSGEGCPRRNFGEISISYCVCTVPGSIDELHGYATATYDIWVSLWEKFLGVARRRNSVRPRRDVDVLFVWIF